MLELRHVYTKYGKVECLKGVSLTVKAGEIVALLGANGAGKTTVLKTISGLIRPTAGEILFGGKPIAGLSPEEVVKLGIAHVPDRMFEFFPLLKKRLRQKAGTLSGGEQQMLAIARGLMSGPSVLLLDEPSLGLAPLLVSAIFGIVDEIHKQGKTILLVEQNARMALKVAERAYVLEIGQMVLEGKSGVLRDNPVVQSAYLGGG